MPPTTSRGPSRTVAGLAVSNFVLLGSVAVIFPLLPDIQEAHGLSTGEIGVISAMAFAAGLIAQLGLARFVDRGYARSMLVTAAVVCAAGLAWFALAETLWQFMGARFVEGLGYALFGPAARAVAAAEDPERMGANLGMLSAGELAGIIVGPLMGSLFGQWWGLDAPFWILAAVSLALAVGLTRVDTSRLDAQRQQHTSRATLRGVVAKGPVRRAALLQLALFLPVGTYDVHWARYLTDLGASSVFVGLSFSIYGIPYVAVALFGTRLIDRVGAVRSAWWSLVAIVPCVVGYGLLGRPGLLAALSIPEAFANAIGAPAAQAAMAEACEPEELGTGQGLGGAMGIGAAGLAAVSMAPLYDAWGGLAAFATTGAAMLVVGAVAMSMGGSLRRSLGAEPTALGGALEPAQASGGVTSVSADR